MRDILFAVQDTVEAIAHRLQAVGDALPRIWNVTLAIVITVVCIVIVVVAVRFGCAVQDDIAPPTVTLQPASREAG